MRNIAIIPIRSGSKGLKDKNIRPLAGKPLVAYTIEAALASEMFDTVLVSTDSERYAEIARSCGAEVPFLRSEENSGDTASSWAVVREVIDNCAEMGSTYDTLALLQATTPLRTGRDIAAAYDVMFKRGANAVVSVCETDVPTEMCNTIPDDRSLVGFFNDRVYRPRQVMDTTYRMNGAIYLYRVEAFLKQKSIYEAKCYAYEMSRVHSIDVDCIDDFQHVEAIVEYYRNHGM